MKLKAKYKWNGEEVMVKPVYFSWHVGLQYKTLTGYRLLFQRMDIAETAASSLNF